MKRALFKMTALLMAAALCASLAGCAVDRDGEMAAESCRLSADSLNQKTVLFDSTAEEFPLGTYHGNYMYQHFDGVYYRDKAFHDTYLTSYFYKGESKGGISDFVAAAAVADGVAAAYRDALDFLDEDGYFRGIVCYRPEGGTEQTDICRLDRQRVVGLYGLGGDWLLVVSLMQEAPVNETDSSYPSHKLLQRLNIRTGELLTLAEETADVTVYVAKVCGDTLYLYVSENEDRYVDAYDAAGNRTARYAVPPLSETEKILFGQYRRTDFTDEYVLFEYAYGVALYRYGEGELIPLPKAVPLGTGISGSAAFMGERHIIVRPEGAAKIFLLDLEKWKRYDITTEGFRTVEILHIGEDGKLTLRYGLPDESTDHYYVATSLTPEKLK